MENGQVEVGKLPTRRLDSGGISTGAPCHNAAFNRAKFAIKSYTVAVSRGFDSSELDVDLRPTCFREQDYERDESEAGLPRGQASSLAWQARLAWTCVPRSSGATRGDQVY